MLLKRVGGCGLKISPYFYPWNLKILGAPGSQGAPGSAGPGHLKSTEVIQRDGTIVAGPDLPVAVAGHTITETKEDEQYMLIGGYSGQVYKSTYYHDNTSNGPWLEGPDLNEARYGHTAGLIFDKVNHTQYTVVVGGWNGSHFLRSVEILKEGSNEWTQGKSSNSFCHCVCLFQSAISSFRSTSA